MYGSRNEAIQTALILGFPLVAACIAGIVAFSLPIFGFVGMVLLAVFAVGSALIIVTKTRAQRRSDRVFDWGPKNMTNTEKIYYLLGYILILFVALSILVIQATGITTK
ncbi:MAG: hypothetical protein J7501_03000 [Bdellovibrio sp.]|nr:hypothetical protein [Bdellovibrio sp.]